MQTSIYHIKTRQPTADDAFRVIAALTPQDYWAVAQAFTNGTMLEAYRASAYARIEWFSKYQPSRS